MIDHHQEKVESLLTKLVSEFLSHEAGPVSLITVTGVSYNQKAKKALVLLSVLPESKEEAAIAFVKRQSSELREYVRSRAKMGILPVFEFAIDIGEKNRQKVDSLSDSTDQEPYNFQG